MFFCILLFTFFTGLPTCKHTQFQCTSSKKCIPREWICDGELDCGVSLNSTIEQDASDEDPLQCNISESSNNNIYRFIKNTILT